MRMAFAGLALFGAACVFAAGAPATAETLTFKTQLSGSKEVPPNTATGKGEVTATYDTATKTLSWKGDYSGLTGPATMAHIHGPADPGKNAPIVIPIFMNPGAAKSPFEGSAKLSERQEQQLLAGELYVNIHTEAHKPGELRGQLTK